MSRVIITGGTGFIGRHIGAALAAAGHEVRAVGRGGVDLARDDEATMASKLSGYEVVINCAGLVQDAGANTMASVHAEGAERLFRACREAGIRRLVHFSALGATATGETVYQQTKGRAEEALGKMTDLDWCVLRPSVVIGRGGASTSLLSALAALAFPPRIGPGTWRVQPAHVSDVAALAVRLVEWEGPLPRSIDVVGAEPMTTDSLVLALRSWLGLPPRPFVPVPESALRALASLGERLMGGAINRDLIVMLKKGNVADPGPMSAALGRPPRRLPEALSLFPASEADRWHARLFFVRPLLRWSLGVFWVVVGLLSFGVYPLSESYKMLAEVGLEGLPATLALFSSALLDVVLGALLLARWRPVAVGGAMLGAMAVFTVISFGLPVEFWTHPFAPLLKNLPIAAATLAMMAMEA